MRGGTLSRDKKNNIWHNATCFTEIICMIFSLIKGIRNRSIPHIVEDTNSDNSTYKLVGAEKIHYLERLVTIQLDLYNWCEEKVGTLATIDAILLAGVTLFIGGIKSGSFPTRVGGNWISNIQIIIEKNFNLVMSLIILLPIFISLGITLWHVIPKMSSGASPSNARNHRSSKGMRSYKNIPEYKERMDSITEDEIYLDLLRQVYGMNLNTWRNQIFIKVAVIFDLVGLLGFLFAIIYLILNGTGSTIFS
jgi:hypothetical protein